MNGNGTRCSALSKRGEPCRAFAVGGTDPPLCRVHAMTPEEVKAHTARMGQRRQQQRRLAADASERTAAIADGVSLEDVLRVCVKLMDAKFDVPGTALDGEPDHAARSSACVVLLNVFPRRLRSTVRDCRAILHELLDGTRHADLARVDPLEHYKAMRAEWWDAAIRHDDLRGLYVKPCPPFMVHESEDLDEIMRTEAPSLDAWSEPKLVETHLGETHVVTIDEDGTEHFVPREPVAA